jgi:predicted  nucleic acid-binding Zn-ribbon protein
MSIDWTSVLIAALIASIPSIWALNRNNAELKKKKVEIADIATQVYERVITQLEKEIEEMTDKHNMEIKELTEQHNKERDAWKKERTGLKGTIADLERTVAVETELRIKLEKKVTELLRKVKVLEQKTGPLPDRT